MEKVEIAPGDTAVTPLRFVSYPWSHSLLMITVWGALFALVYRRLGRPRRAAILLFLLVLSHWVLDFVTHRPDMPLLPLGGPLLGLGLWNSRGATILVEGFLFASAVILFAKKRVPRWGFFALMTLLVALYAASLFGPPPPSVTAIALSGIAVVPILWWWGNRC